MSKELRLIKEAFCRDRGLPLTTALELQQQGVTRAGDPIFLVFGPSVSATRYTYTRYDVTPLTQYNPGLSLDAEFKINPALINMESIAAWVNSKTNINMLPSDIGQVIITDKVRVVISANSMRFKHSFSMAFK